MKVFNKKLNKRDRELGGYILETIKKYKNPKKCSLIEIGMGGGRFGFLIGNKFKKYSGIEPNREYLKIANETKINKKFNYRLGRAEKIPFKEKFDVIFYSFSWHFIKNYDKAIKESKRILKDDGIVLIIDPIENSKGWIDKRLIKGSKEFDKNLYNKKVKKIRKSVRELKKQKGFKIIFEESEYINLWVLQKL